jgi:hypothetical protein
MTEFATNLRRRCRNPKCRLKLPEPVSNEREAFCCRGCYRSFYRHRCLICEQPMERSRTTAMAGPQGKQAARILFSKGTGAANRSFGGSMATRARQGAV